ncbi:MAG: Stage V sporulation protein E [Candidatus Roizmanbacteria bacterium GW2011_GWB1_40_7]|uniref:Probable peptidoglycan glycosyltransferase FtsW n=1 Tax=Candidatus Roizmanbacteria bacterium GW2011_GWB1_40_7 TaxID=1618482 RepID=A0A0G0VGY4_9BACT|nr:MAG: Stage V sporulation protein E [Candidatus Levybacteria bacterium GW2011_GWA1_37_16]KKR71300.1 MAG: Stage V sporulation protein E [Candidatus Roizmanbacteria bacterium GW2011_GWB1_40_7]
MKKIDISLLISVIILTFFGLFMIYDVSSFVAFRDFEDKYHYIKDQFLWVVLGFGALTFFSIFDYRRLYALALPILLIALILLTLVFIPGIGVSLLGARRWIDAGAFLLQPAEFVKLGLAIYLAAWFSNKEKGRFPAFLLLMGLVLGLVMIEPDMGTAIVILAEALIIYFLSGASILHFSLAVPLIGFLGYLLIIVSPYRTKRLDTFLNIDLSSESSYHVKQILIALGSGGLTGVGLGNSLQKYAYLPEGTTDSIFAIIAEELGFVGAVGLILFFIFIIFRCFRIVVNCRDNFGKLLAGGITTFLAIQIIINLAAQTALVPLTGIPLPFISYGGSALIVDLAAVGILLNISKNRI